MCVCVCVCVSCFKSIQECYFFPFVLWVKKSLVGNDHDKKNVPWKTKRLKFFVCHSIFYLQVRTQSRGAAYTLKTSKSPWLSLEREESRQRCTVRGMTQKLWGILAQTMLSNPTKRQQNFLRILQLQKRLPNLRVLIGNIAHTNIIPPFCVTPRNQYQQSTKGHQWQWQFLFVVFPSSMHSPSSSCGWSYWNTLHS